MIKAIFFDIDGTLLDTTEYIYQAFEHSLSSHNLPLLDRKNMSYSVGEPLEACYQTFSGLTDVEHLMDSHRVFQLNNPILAFPFNNTLDTLQRLKKAGIMLGSVTTRSSETVQKTLEAGGIDTLLEHIITFDDVTNAKPDPEGIYKNLHYFGIEPEEAMMVGDSPVDILAGKNAGVKTVGVTYGFHGEKIRESNPDHMIDDIFEIVQLVSRQ